jgi:hypothetical protein
VKALRLQPRVGGYAMLRRRVPVRWCVCIVVLEVLTAAWWVSGWWYYQWVSNTGYTRVGLIRGSVDLCWGTPAIPVLGQWVHSGYESDAIPETLFELRWEMVPRVLLKRSYTTVVVPLWLVALPVIVGACVPAKRRETGCPKCGYTRQGRNVFTECPECGAVGEARDARAWW